MYIATPLEVCIKRDPQGLYKKVRAGLIKNFTGIDDPYEIPDNPEIILDTVADGEDKYAQKIISHLQESGYI